MTGSDFVILISEQSQLCLDEKISICKQNLQIFFSGTLMMYGRGDSSTFTSGSKLEGRMGGVSDCIILSSVFKPVSLVGELKWWEIDCAYVVSAVPTSCSSL